MDIFNVLTLLGGLALFLYGMELMGDSLALISGHRLKSILENLTSNKYKGVLLGAGVTAVIQSSSASTVMVVGLVNSGIMKLTQAIPIIMGANIGTTITGWILSLTGLQSDNFFIKMLKPTSFAPLFAIIAVFYLLLGKNENKKSIARIVLGFSILMFGMDTMSNAMKPLAEMPQFQRLFTLFSNPILGVLAGAILTALLQSSSASLGILQALSATGLINMSSAIPIIMGQNIGTCITAALSGIGAKRNAKRAALTHLLFNIIGTSLFIIGFYSSHAIFKFAFVNHDATPLSIAVVHTIFNIVTTGLLIQFTGSLEKLVRRILPETKEERRERVQAFAALDDRLLDTPSIALEQCVNLSNEMFTLAKDSVLHALQLIDHYNDSDFRKVIALEKKVDAYQDALSSYLIKISREALTDEANTNQTLMLNCINDFERASDHALSIALSLKDMQKEQQCFSTQALAELKVFASALVDILVLTQNAYKSRSNTLAVQVEPLEEVIDQIHEAIKFRHVERLRQGLCSVTLGMSLTDVSTSMERIADHCSNIAVAIIEIQLGAYYPHKYLKRIKTPGNMDFQAMYESYLQQYSLPDSDFSLEHLHTNMESGVQTKESTAIVH